MAPLRFTSHPSLPPEHLLPQLKPAKSRETMSPSEAETAVYPPGAATVGVTTPNKLQQAALLAREGLAVALRHEIYCSSLKWLESDWESHSEFAQNTHRISRNISGVYTSFCKIVSSRQWQRSLLTAMLPSLSCRPPEFPTQVKKCIYFPILSVFSIYSTWHSHHQHSITFT